MFDKISLEVRNRLSVYSSRSLVGLHLLEGFPDFPFGDVERLCLVHGLLPLPVGSVGLWPRLNNAAPSLQPHYRAFITTTGCSVPVLRIGTLILAVLAACDSLPLHRSTGSHVPYKSLVELRAAYMPDAARAVFRTSPELIPEEGSAPGFDIV